MAWPYTQMAQLAANVQPEVAPVVEEEPQPQHQFRRWLAAFGENNEEQEAARPDAGNEEAEGFDIVDFVYMIFRFVLIIGLCIVYSSWQRMVLVALVAAYFYWYE